MADQNQIPDAAQTLQVTDAMIEAGARAMAKADSWHRWQGYANMAKRCLEAALAAQPPAASVTTHPIFPWTKEQFEEAAKLLSALCQWAEPRGLAELEALKAEARGMAKRLREEATR